MSRETSISVYHQVEKEGLIGKMQTAVLRDIAFHGPTTQGETSQRLNIDRNIASPRFAELKRRGVIREALKRPCLITGRTCFTWEMTNEWPSRPEQATHKIKIAALWDRIKELEKEVDRLKRGELF